ncbi:MAG: MlaD family protein, partial [Candidatus Hydrogenedentota bacterium]
MQISAEKKVGCVFLIGMIALAVITIILGNFTIFDRGKIYYIIFDDVRGLNVGDAVRLSGLEVGKVQALDIAGNKIKVTIWTQSNVVLREGCRIYVQDDTLIGGKVLAITMAPSTNPTIPVYSTIYGDKPETAKDVFNELAALGSDIRELVVSFNENQKIFFNKINKILTDDREAFLITLENFNNMALDFQDVAERAIAIIKKIEEAEGTVGKLISSDEIYVDAKDISEKINR